MTFIYPAVLTPHKEDEGYHVTFPDLVGCEADGPMQWVKSLCTMAKMS